MCTYGWKAVCAWGAQADVQMPSTLSQSDRALLQEIWELRQVLDLSLEQALLDNPRLGPALESLGASVKGATCGHMVVCAHGW